MSGFEKQKASPDNLETVSGVVSRIGVGFSYDSPALVSVFILLVGESAIRALAIDCHLNAHPGQPPFLAEWSLTQSGDAVTLITRPARGFYGASLVGFKNETLSALQCV